jgi:hypothetical protein
MKLLRAAVIILFLGFSRATAESFYFGVRFDAPIYFDSVDQTTNINVDPMFGVQFGWDAESASSGFGLRGSLSTRFVSGVRLAFDGYVRSPVVGVPELNSYLGAGLTGLADPGFVSYLNAHLLVGVEYQLLPTVGLFAEFSPGLTLGISKITCGNYLILGEPPVAQPPCNLIVPFTLEAAIGLNFRF